MMLRIESSAAGLHPSEAVIAVHTKDGFEEIIVDRKLISAGRIPVGWPVGRDGKYLLVELPRQTMGGSWRVWVSEDSLEVEQERARA